METPLTLLQIVQTAMGEMGLVEPAVVIGSTDVQVQQIYRLVNRELTELQQDKEWTVLQAEFNLHVAQPIITTGDTTLNSYQIINIPTTAGVNANTFVCNAGNIPVAARVVSVDSNTQVTLSEPATGTQTGVTCTFARDTYAEPPDFSRFINQTWWDRTNRWSLLGPDSPQVDQWHRSGIVTIGPRRHFRQIGPVIPGGFSGDFNNDFSSDFSSTILRNNYRLWPPPGTLDTPIDLAFEYISNWVVINPFTQTGQTTFLADTDYTVLSAQAIIMGVKWRYFQIKGWDYAPLQAEAVDFVNRLYANDGGNKTLSLAPMRQNLFITSSNVQDGSYPGPSGPNSS
jgi:hypothetical protein